MKVYRYYTLYRPPMPGGIPRGAVKCEEWSSRPYIKEIAHTAWGYVDYNRQLTRQEIENYELAPASAEQNYVKEA